MAQDSDLDLIAREIKELRAGLEMFEKRLLDVERVNARLEAAALTTARAMTEISRHWDAVYEAMRRAEESRPDYEGTP